MSESERRRKYRHDRVLIETARVLPSTLADAVVFLSGAQLEMLRNVTQYLRRLETYATEYHPGYYLTPTPDDYDDILAIVADLEETLMGNPNTLWGYKAIYKEYVQWSDASPGTKDLDFDPISAGSVCRLQGFAFRNEDSAIPRVVARVVRNAVNYIVLDVDTLAVGVWHSYACDVILEAGDYLVIDMYGVVQDDWLHWQASGYLMDVPE